MKNTQKGFIVPLLIAIIAVLAIGGGIYVFEQSKHQQAEQQPNDTSLSLNFFAGGSIMGSSFKTDILKGEITYQEFEPSDRINPIKKIERQLTQPELDSLLTTISDSKLLNLQSQDFNKEPMIPDQGGYDVSLTLDDKSNDIECSIAPPQGVENKTKECQNQIDKLRDTLNKILGVNIY